MVTSVACPLILGGAVANPASPFAGELGNRIHFGLKVVASHEFSLNDLKWELDSDDSDDYFDQLG